MNPEILVKIYKYEAFVVVEALFKEFDLTLASL